MPSLLSLVFAPSANAQTSWKPQAIPSQQVFSNVEFLAHQNPFRLKALNSKEFLLTFEEPQALCAIPDLSTDQTDRSSVAARVVGAVPPTIWLARPDQQLIRYTPPIALESPARASNNSLVLARQKTTHSGDLKLLKLSQSSIECLNRNWIRLYLQQQHLAVRDVFRRTCFRKKDVPARAYTSSTRYFSEDHDGFYGVDVDTRDSSTTIADAYSAPVSDEEGKLAPTIALTQMDTVVEVLQATTANKVEPPKAVEEPNDSYVFVFPDEEEELEMLIREEAPKDLERMAEQARKASLVSTDQRSEAQVNDEAHLTPPEEVVRHRLDEEEDSEADTDVKADPATPEVATHYRLSDEMHDLGKESEEAAHEVQNEELHQDVVVVAVIQPSSSEIPRPRSPRPTSIDLPPHTFLVHNYERETIRGLEDHLLRSQNAPPHVIAELENPPRRPYVVPDGTELDPYWAPYENGSLIPESTTTSPEVCLWSANYSGDVDFYASCVREWWDNTQGAKLHDNMRRHALCINAWSHVYAVDSTVDYRAPYGAMNQPLAEAEYDPSMSGVKRKWWYKPGAKGFKALGNPETMTQQYLPNGARKLVHAETATNRRAFYPQRSRLREAQNASDDADEDSYVSTSDFDQTPAEEFQHLYAGFSQDMLDGGNASDRSESGIEEGQDEDDEEELPEEEIEGGINFALEEDDMTSQSVREARADARSGSMNGRQSRFGRRDDDLDSEESDTELLESPVARKRSLSAPPSLYQEALMAGFSDAEHDAEEDNLLLEQDEDGYNSGNEYTADEPTFGEAHIIVMQRQARVFGQDDDALDSSMVQDDLAEHDGNDAASEAPEDLSPEDREDDDAVGAEQEPGPDVDSASDEGQDEHALVLRDLLIAAPSSAPVQPDEMEYPEDSKPRCEDPRRDSGIGSCGSSSPDSTSNSSSSVHSRVSSFAEAAMNAALQDVIEQSFINAQHQESKISTAKIVVDAASRSISGATTQAAVVNGDNDRDVWLIDQAPTSSGLATTAVASEPVYATFTPAQRTASGALVKLIASGVPYSTLEMSVKITGRVRAYGRAMRQIPALAWGSSCGAVSTAATLGNRAVGGVRAVARTVWHILTEGPIVLEEVEQLLG